MIAVCKSNAFLEVSSSRVNHLLVKSQQWKHTNNK